MHASLPLLFLRGRILLLFSHLSYLLLPGKWYQTPIFHLSSSAPAPSWLCAWIQTFHSQVSFFHFCLTCCQYIRDRGRSCKREALNQSAFIKIEVFSQPCNQQEMAVQAWALKVSLSRVVPIWPFYEQETFKRKSRAGSSPYKCPWTGHKELLLVSPSPQFSSMSTLNHKGK